MRAGGGGNFVYECGRPWEDLTYHILSGLDNAPCTKRKVKYVQVKESE